MCDTCELSLVEVIACLDGGTDVASLPAWLSLVAQFKAIKKSLAQTDKMAAKLLSWLDL